MITKILVILLCGQGKMMEIDMGQTCNAWGLFTHTRHYYFPLQQNIKIGFDLSDVVKASKIATDYLEKMKLLLKIKPTSEDDIVLEDNVKFKLMPKALPHLAREICRSEKKSLPTFTSSTFLNKVVPIMKDSNIDNLLVVAKFTDKKVYLIEDLDGKEIMVYHRSIDTDSGEKAAAQFTTTSRTGELEEVALKQDGTFDLTVTTDGTKKAALIPFLCQYYDPVVQTRPEMVGVLQARFQEALKLVDQLISDLTKGSEMANADYLVGLQTDLIDVVKAEPSKNLILLFECMDKMFSEKEVPTLDLAELDLIIKYSHELYKGLVTDRGDVIPIEITDEIRTKLGIKHYDDVVGQLIFQPKTNTLQPGDWIIGGEFEFLIKSYNNIVTVQDYKPFWHQGMLLQRGYLVNTGRQQYLTHVKPEFLQCDLDFICLGEKYIHPTLRELQCAHQILEEKYSGNNFCRIDESPSPILAYRTGCRPPSNTIISKQLGEMVVERLCENKPIEKLYLYDEQYEFRDSCRLRFRHHDILNPLPDLKGEQGFLGLHKVESRRDGIQAVQENVWYQITVFGGIGLLASTISMIVTYAIVRSRIKASQAREATSKAIGATQAAVASLTNSINELNKNTRSGTTEEQGSLLPQNNVNVRRDDRVMNQVVEVLKTSDQTKQNA